jgi:hypothetical protein
VSVGGGSPAPRLIFFDEGWIIYAAIVNRRDRLGDMLLANGLVTRAQLDQALALQNTAPSRRIGDLLVNLGILAPEQLRRFVRLQIEEAVYSLFAWNTGTFSFEAGVRPDSEDVLERINPESLLLEGARRVDEWSLIEKKIPSFDLIYAVLDGTGRRPQGGVHRGPAADRPVAGRAPRPAGR